VARFTVDQRKPAFGLDLFAMDAVPEVVGYFVMLVTPGNTVISTDILRIKSSDNKFLVFAHREQRTTLLDLRTCG
jgi:hypothetical protein